MFIVYQLLSLGRLLIYLQSGVRCVGPELFSSLRVVALKNHETLEELFHFGHFLFCQRVWLALSLSSFLIFLSSFTVWSYNIHLSFKSQILWIFSWCVFCLASGSITYLHWRTIVPGRSNTHIPCASYTVCSLSPKWAHVLLAHKSQVWKNSGLSKI